MNDLEETTLLNVCAELVTAKTHEAFPLHLLTERKAGEWVSVRELCRHVGLAHKDVATELYVSWLADPVGRAGYAVILFLDDSSKWTMAAHYNRQRLANQTRQAVAPALGIAETAASAVADATRASAQPT